MVNFSLYYHIPFCTRKCDYCHFYVLPDRESEKALLMEGFKREWQTWLPQFRGKKLSSLYFGGGTPALLGPERIAEIISWVQESFPETVEVTLEANPDSLSPPLLNAYRKAGINRLSIGLQTLDDGLLQKLGRTHSAQKAIDSVFMAAESGISNITVDLMYDIPFQTLSQWDATLEKLRHLPITHLSLYNLTIEPETIFFKKRALLQPALPDPDTSLKMYQNAIEALKTLGLEQYEISAFAKPGFHSRHNVGYWTARPFIGFGPSAFSYWEKSRFRNVSHLKRYYEALESGHSPVDFSETLSEEAHRRELLAVQLRLVSGVDLDDFEYAHGPLDLALNTTLQELQDKGLLATHNRTMTLTPHGRLFYDSVASEIVFIPEINRLDPVKDNYF